MLSPLPHTGSDRLAHSLTQAVIRASPPGFFSNAFYKSPSQWRASWNSECTLLRDGCTAAGTGNALPCVVNTSQLEREMHSLAWWINRSWNGECTLLRGEYSAAGTENALSCVVNASQMQLRWTVKVLWLLWVFSSTKSRGKSVISETRVSSVAYILVIRTLLFEHIASLKILLDKNRIIENCNSCHKSSNWCFFDSLEINPVLGGIIPVRAQSVPSWLMCDLICAKRLFYSAE